MTTSEDLTVSPAVLMHAFHNALGRPVTASVREVAESVVTHREPLGAERRRQIAQDISMAAHNGHGDFVGAELWQDVVKQLTQ